MANDNLQLRKGFLKQKQSLPLAAKIIIAERRVREWHERWDGNIYVSFSGGKDSTVLLDIVKRLYPDVPAVFVDTGLEYPEIRAFAIARADVVLRPVMRFDEVIKKHGYPVISKEVANCIEGARRGSATRLARLRGELTGKNGETSVFNCAQWGHLLDAPFAISDRCCDEMKKKPFKAYEKETGRKPIVGTMAEESRLRLKNYLRNGCNAFDGAKAKSAPLSVWLEQDILQYIAQNKLEIASIYGSVEEHDQLPGQTRLFADQWDELTTTGAKRTGCMFCMFGAHCEGSPNRFQRMKETHPRQYAYCMKPVEDGGLGLRDVLEYIGIPYE